MWGWVWTPGGSLCSAGWLGRTAAQELFGEVAEELEAKLQGSPGTGRPARRRPWGSHIPHTRLHRRTVSSGWLVMMLTCTHLPGCRQHGCSTHSTHKHATHTLPSQGTLLPTRQHTNVCSSALAESDFAAARWAVQGSACLLHQSWRRPPRHCHSTPHPGPLLPREPWPPRRPGRPGPWRSQAQLPRSRPRSQTRCSCSLQPCQQVWCGLQDAWWTGVWLGEGVLVSPTLGLRRAV